MSYTSMYVCMYVFIVHNIFTNSFDLPAKPIGLSAGGYLTNKCSTSCDFNTFRWKGSEFYAINNN